MNIFYFSAEVEPFAKSGGLGDVLGALPKAVAKQKDNNVYVVMPYYKDIIKLSYKAQMEYLGYFYTDVNWRHQYVGVYKLVRDNVNYIFLDNEYYFQGPMYCFADNERFAYFCKASLDLVGWLGVKADILHCNDWSTGYIPVLKHAFYGACDSVSGAKTVYTIHNLKYQGWMSVEFMKDLTGLPDWYFTDDRLLASGGVNLMKGAMIFADAVTTVSDTYAKEIATPEYGEGLDGVVRSIAYKMSGIINGVDYTVYNPAHDELIDVTYNRVTYKKGKNANKVALQRTLGLPQREDVPMFAFVSRMVDQKGLDLLLPVTEDLLQHDIQIVVLGTGELRYEHAFKEIASRHPDRMSACIFFDNTLAHRVYAAADFVLLPSLFEPCGLTQLIALKYGAVPIVRETGGLVDTVKSYNEETGEGNGFSFAPLSSADLEYTINRAIDFYYNRNKIYRTIQRFGMGQDFSWKESSARYITLYRNLARN